MNYVLDACALIALINHEEGYEKVAEIFARASSGEVMLYMSIVNLIEVFYHFIRTDSLDVASAILAPISETPLIVIDRISHAVYQEAARLKAIYKRISISDVIGLAAAKDMSAAFVTSDHHEMDMLNDNENIRGHDSPLVLLSIMVFNVIFCL